MKLNQTLMLAAFVAGGLLTGIPLQAQDASNQPAATAPAMRRPPFSAEAMSQRLELTDDQKPKVKPILEDLQKKNSELAKDKGLTPADRRAKMKENRDAASAQLKEILTPEQYAKWEKMGPGSRRPQPAAPGAPAAPAADDKAKN
ncbi:MAG: hypothetical protein P4N60_12125 [Verrucomicrobiae bacterium]|nr:hypothetical protein [Verrucomicrobiae bacterium]